MTQDTIKKILSVTAGIVAAIIGAQTAGQIHLPAEAIGWLGIAGIVLGTFGASPIGRVIGQKERRELEPVFPRPDQNDDVITSDERPQRR
jgi:hypothetical protein